MKRLSHLIWTTGLSLFIYTKVLDCNLFLTFIITFFTAVLSSLPDIDIKITKACNKLNKKTFHLLTPLKLLVNLIFKHRGITHSFLIPSILGITLIILKRTEFKYITILSYLIIILIIALLMHILEDSLTISGVKVFYPFFQWKLRLGYFKTDSKIDELILNLIGIGIIVLFFIYNIF